MAPRENVTAAAAAPSKEVARKALNLNKIREAIPKEAFRKGSSVVIGILTRVFYSLYFICRCFKIVVLFFL